MTEPIEIYNFEPLFGKDIKGKIKTWDLKVERYQNYSVIVILYGYNRLIETRRQINIGKNIGKVNSTTPYTQAISEARSKWIKKRDIEKYYTESKTEESKTDEPKAQLRENLLPMLAHDFKKHKTKVIYPAMVQCKLDGFRCIYNTTTGQISTRTGKEYNIIKQSGKLYEELQKLPKGLILDGELYTNKLNFEVLGVLRKTKQLTKEELINLQKIEYHIYDIINIEDTFEQRNKKIQELDLSSFEKLIYVDTFLVKNEEEIKEYHTKFLESGFEGLMVRNKHSLYKIKQRSSDLLKYKDFEDAEFEIIDYTFEKNIGQIDENLVVWIIAVPAIENSVTKIKVKVRPKGSFEERKELYKMCVENFDQFKSRNLWTSFFEYTRDGSLRFPSTLRNTYTEYIRDIIM